MTAQSSGHESPTGSQPGSFAIAPVSIKIQPRHAVQHAMVLTSLTPYDTFNGRSPSPRGLLFSNALPNYGNQMHNFLHSMQASICDRRQAYEILIWLVSYAQDCYSLRFARPKSSRHKLYRISWHPSPSIAVTAFASFWVERNTLQMSEHVYTTPVNECEQTS